MKGVKFVVDETGEKTAVVIELAEHRELWEDFYDVCLARERAADPRESLADVRDMLGIEGE